MMQAKNKSDLFLFSKSRYYAILFYKLVALRALCYFISFILKLISRGYKFR